DALEKVGPDGVVTVEEAKGIETKLRTVEGMQFDKGYVSPYFVTDPEVMEAVLADPLILLHDRKISALADLVPLLEKVAQAGASLLLVAEDFEGEALAALAVNKLRGVLSVCAVRAPTSTDGSPRSGARSTKPPRTTIARSSASARPSWPAASR